MIDDKAVRISYRG